jgi:hypothetical protein
LAEGRNITELTRKARVIYQVSSDAAREFQDPIPRAGRSGNCMCGR